MCNSASHIIHPKSKIFYPFPLPFHPAFSKLRREFGSEGIANLGSHIPLRLHVMLFGKGIKLFKNDVILWFVKSYCTFFEIICLSIDKLLFHFEIKGIYCSNRQVIQKRERTKVFVAVTDKLLFHCEISLAFSKNKVILWLFGKNKCNYYIYTFTYPWQTVLHLHYRFGRVHFDFG